jgi:ATP-dependent helicase/nuclease subunit A
VELWREKRFEIVLGREWVTGSFDRVVLRRDVAGRLLGADILDYKSNQVEGDEALHETAEHYRPQLDLYARALSRMLGLPAKAIGRHLLFTHPARVITLADGGEIKRD